jgi:hypothetical protein
MATAVRPGGTTDADDEPDSVLGECSPTDGAHVEGCDEVMSGHDAGVAPRPQKTTKTTKSAAPRAAAVVAGDSSRKRAKRPDIDYDEKIQEATKNIKEMARAMAAAKSAQKNERRKKQRLVKKASQLSPEDLERIAVLKRCGMWTAEGRGPLASHIAGAKPAGQEASRGDVSTSSSSRGVAVVGTANVCSTSSKLHIEGDSAGQREGMMAGALE